MLGVEDYGSGSDSEGESQSKSAKSSLPPSSSSKAPVKKKKTIAIGLPTLKPVDDDQDDPEIAQPPAKKLKLGTGSGSSSLFSMLPAPKKTAPVPAAPERVLGSGKGPGLVFNASRSEPSSTNNLVAEDSSAKVEPTAESSTSSSTSFVFRPPSLAKGKANISLEEQRPKASFKAAASSSSPAVDFFGLGSVSSSRPSPALPESGPSVLISSAPEIATFEVPEPSVSDPYPGYYQLPSGEWRQHDVEYYEKFRRKWEKEYNDHIRALEKGAVKGFEGYDRDDLADVDAAKEMEKAKLEIKEREERKAVSKNSGEPEKPKINVTASKMSGVARSRHQLATMLHEAYSNREVLEEKIAEGRRNRKEAGNKYGF